MPITNGNMYPKGSLQLSVFAGEAKGENSGITYTLLNTTSNTMMVESSKTGKRFSICWEDVITLAIENGINNEE